MTKPHIAPTLFVGLGGSGAEVGRRLKAKAEENGLNECIEYLIIDSDDSATKEFDREQVVHLGMGPVLQVLRNPTLHPFLAERLNLLNDEKRRILTTIASKKLPGAFQVRPLGLLAFYANMNLVLNAVARAITNLESRWKQLKQVLQGNGQGINARKSVVIVTSICGGTGSSILIDIASLIRNEYPEADLHIYSCMPSVFQSELAGQSYEWIRMQSNAVATLRELEAVQSGKAKSFFPFLGKTDTRNFQTPETVAERVYLIGNKENAGAVVSMQAIFDTVAMNLLATIGTEIGQRAASVDANSLAGQNGLPCKRTKRLRNYSTMNAVVLEVPREDIVEYCSTRLILDCYNTALSGSQGEFTDTQVMEQVKTLDSSLGFSYDSVMANSGVQSPAEAASRERPKFFKLFTPTTRIHFGKADFLRKVAEETASSQNIVRRYIKDNGPILKKHFERIEDGLLKKIDGTIPERGIRYAIRLIDLLIRCLEGYRGNTEERKRQTIADRQKAEVNLKNLCGRLKSVFAMNSKAKQNQIVDCHVHRLQCLITEHMHNAHIAWASGLVLKLEERRSRMNDVLGDLSQAMRRSEGEFQKLKNGAWTVFNNATAVLHVVPNDFRATFFDANSRTSQQMFEDAATSENQSISGFIESLRLETVQSKFMNLAENYFKPLVDGLDIIELLNAQLCNGSKDDMHAILQQAVIHCRPLWRANIGIATESFSDLIFCGLPCSLDEIPVALKSTIEKAQSGSQDHAHNANIAFVTTHDASRIFFFRRVHGGRPEYLHDWQENTMAYHSWHENPSHDVHIFPKEAVANMEMLEICEN